jgi:hypothetical protein
VVWTSTSVKSDFVRAEAGRAKADGKLIPVKDRVSYGDIPLPFGEMHTEDLAKRELIRAAVVAQLAKPAVHPSALWLAGRTLRYQVLTWVGIVGGGITLFTNLQGVLNLADWARWLAIAWHNWTEAFWQTAFGWLGISFPRQLAPLLTFIAFGFATCVGARRWAAVPKEPAARTSIGYLAIFSLVYVMTFYLTDAALAMFYVRAPYELLTHSPTHLMFYSLLPPCVAILCTVQAKWPDKIVFGLLICIFYGLIFVLQANGTLRWIEDVMPHWLLAMSRFFPDWPATNPSVGIFTMAALDAEIRTVRATSIFLGPSLAFTMLMMARMCPLAPLNRRLSFVLIGLVILVGLNQLSLYAPVVREWLRPAV